MYSSSAISALSERFTSAQVAVDGGEMRGPTPNQAQPLALERQADREAESRHGTVLIVENEENNRRLVEQILGFAGYPYLSATNGIEALDIIGRTRVDVVLIDLSMPILDGYRTTELIRQRPECAALPIVAVTAHAMTEDRELALRAGCTEYLAKPFRPTELLSVVARMLAGVER